MIVRVWHGRTPLAKAADYKEFIKKTGITDYRNTPRNLGARMIQQEEEDVMHIWTISYWPDFDSIKKFAGDDVEKAHYYDEDSDYLLEFEPTVYHFETASVEIHDRIQKSLVQIYSHGGWYGESFMQKLTSIKDEVAFKQPMPNVHSVAEILWHCIYWRNSAIKSLQGVTDNLGSMDAAENWMSIETLKPKGWDSLKALFQQSQIELIDRYVRTPLENLEKEYRPGTTLLTLMEGIVHHDIYHLGQIGLVRRMMSM